MRFNLESLILKNSTRPNWIIAKISDEEEFGKEKGQLFCIAELLNATKEKTDAVSSLVQFTFSLFGDPREQYNGGSEGFEKLLEEANKKFTAISSNLPSDSFSDFSIILGQVHENNLNIASHGKLGAWHMQPLQAAQHKYRLLNILESQDVEKQKSKKLFEQIISGSLTLGQTFIVATPSLLQYISEDRLKNILTKKPISAITHEIEEFINGLPRPQDVALIVGANEEAVIPQDEQLTKVTEASIDEKTGIPVSVLSKNTFSL